MKKLLAPAGWAVSIVFYSALLIWVFGWGTSPFILVIIFATALGTVATLGVVVADEVMDPGVTVALRREEVARIIAQHYPKQFGTSAIRCSCGAELDCPLNQNWRKVMAEHQAAMLTDGSAYLFIADNHVGPDFDPWGRK